jgi:hypothetical protein
MNKFSGIDLHSNNSVVVVSDEADRIVYQRRLSNDPVQSRAALARPASTHAAPPPGDARSFKCPTASGLKYATWALPAHSGLYDTEIKRCASPPRGEPTVWLSGSNRELLGLRSTRAAEMGRIRSRSSRESGPERP